MLTKMTTRAITAATLAILCLCKLSEGTREISAFNCKFPNEACNDNSECCSGKCVDAHPGTNARCTKLRLHKPCLYTYQCEDRLRCGKENTCCAKYWGICSHARDCCDPAHKCFDAEGFYYKRCLYSNNLSQKGSTCRSRFLLTVTFAAVTLFIITQR